MADSEVRRLQSELLDNLKRLTRIIEGDTDQENGLLNEHREMKKDLYGNGDRLGALAKMNIMWRIQLALATSLGGLIGAIIVRWTTHP